MECLIVFYPLGLCVCACTCVFLMLCDLSLCVRRGVCVCVGTEEPPACKVGTGERAHCLIASQTQLQDLNVLFRWGSGAGVLHTLAAVCIADVGQSSYRSRDVDDVAGERFRVPPFGHFYNCFTLLQ